jgi:MFS family permease
MVRAYLQSVKVSGRATLSRLVRSASTPQNHSRIAAPIALPISQLDSTIIESDIPARLDRLPWGLFHTLVVVTLAFTWVLVGLEVTLAEALSRAIRASLPVTVINQHVVSTNAPYELTNTAYLLGAVCGALYFGRRTDREGRKKMFVRTLFLYAMFTFATAFSFDFVSLGVFRFFTGAGIGGEYVAINSTIQELIPSKYRGRTTIAVNGTWWLGAALIAAGSIVLPDGASVSQWGWRAAFLTGAIVAGSIYFLRQWLPESPRWLVTHHRADEGAAIIELIEEGIRSRGQKIEPVSVVSRPSGSVSVVTDVIGPRRCEESWPDAA